jgi:four helix bundle protein
MAGLLQTRRRDSIRAGEDTRAEATMPTVRGSVDSAVPPVSSNDGRYIVGRQLVRSATSIAANYRAACRARSAVEFVSRIGVVAEEADEAQFWLELSAEAGIMPSDEARDLTAEASSLTAIFTASRNTAKAPTQRAEVTG